MSPETGEVRLHVSNKVDNEDSILYVFAWLRAPDHQSGVADYVSWDVPGSETCNVTEPSCGWLRSTDAGSIGSLPRFNLFYAGNWTVEAACVKPVSDDASCTVGANSENAIDLLKWRTTMPIENEHAWDDGCRLLLGVKDGPVRVIRRVQGAASGRYTTKHDLFYGTWFEQIVNLRVHPIGSVRANVESRALDATSPRSESPAAVFTQSHSAMNANLAMDAMDALQPGSVNGSADDWVQVDTTRGTLIHFFDEPRPFQDVNLVFEYTDTPVSEDDENQRPLRYGEFGVRINPADAECIPNTDLDNCPANQDPEDPILNFRTSRRTLIPLSVDTPDPGTSTFRSEEGVKYGSYRGSPWVTGVCEQGFGVACPGGGTPCVPTIGVTSDAGGTHNALNLNFLACGSSFSGAEVHRGTAPGVYGFLADVGKQTSFKDLRVEPGLTYRYVVRAYDVDGNVGAFSSEVVAAVADTLAPDPPTNLAATPGAGLAILNWDAVGSHDVQGYYINIATTSGGPYSRIGDPETCDLQGLVTGLQSGTTYYFTVTSFDADGNESAPSLEASATPL